MEITEANIERACNAVMYYNTPEEAMAHLVEEGATEDVAYLLVVAVNQLMTSRA